MFATQHFEITTDYGLVSFFLVRSPRRRTIAIEICPDATIKARAPVRIAKEDVCRFIREKARWITQKVREVPGPSASAKISFKDGDRLLFLGRSYPLTYCPQETRKIGVSFRQDHWQVGIPWDMPADAIELRVRQALEAWYRREAKTYLTDRVFFHAEALDQKDLKVFVRSQKRIWGSCHPRTRSIFLNWKIIMAPISVIDYVILHELCHLKVPDHSRRFKRVLSQILPSHRESERTLKSFGSLLAWDRCGP